VRRKRFEVVEVGRDHDPVRLGEGDDDRVHGGAATRQPSKVRGPTSRALRHGLDNVASLKEPVGIRIARGPLKALDEHDGRNDGRPQAFSLKDAQSRDRLDGARGEGGNRAGVENQHGVSRPFASEWGAA
jgi:hypothetical protein